MDTQYTVVFLYRGSLFSCIKLGIKIFMKSLAIYFGSSPVTNFIFSAISFMILILDGSSKTGAQV